MIVCDGCGWPASIRDDRGRGLTCGCAAIEPNADRVPGTHPRNLTHRNNAMTHGRPIPTLATACAALASALSQSRPAWCSDATWTAAVELVRLARSDLRAATDGRIPSKRDAREVRERLGAARSTVAEWLRGWLRD